jgi:signal transduction histidine kinase
VAAEDSEKITLQIEVSDNGIGISEEQQKTLFDIFEQADGGMTGRQGGIGIGLPLAKRIINMMGGDIWVESEHSKGAKFYLTCALTKNYGK